MNSVNPLTVRVQNNTLQDHVAAYRIALELFGTAALADFLPSRQHPRYWEILCELICAEIAHGWSAGTPIALDEYQARYPELFERAPLVYRLAQEEFSQRQQAGEDPSMTEYTAWKSPLDPEISSKLDSVLPPSASEYIPATRWPSETPASNWPSIEVGQTHPNRSAGGPIPSDPEIVWKLNQVMTEMPKVGDDFLGFSLLAELGKGAFGKVFLAQQADLAGRFVALKVAAGLFTESQTLAQLQHTHIVPIFSYHHGQPFQAVCMPYLGSTTLAHILADIRTHKAMPSSGKELISTLNFRKKSTRRFEDLSRECGPDFLGISAPEESDAAKPAAPMSMLELEGMSYVDSILWLAVRLADGLAHAHERGIIHRDLKPANVLLTDDGLPMLLDFNLAQDTKARDNAAAASIGGTLPYMAPEHLEAFRGCEKTVDARSDLYSLGVILFELLTGAAPFATYRKLAVRDVIERMISDREFGGPLLRDLNPSIPPAVEAIVRRCLECDPARRYQTARELREDLQRQLEDKPLKHAANPSLWERGQKFRRRHPRLTSATSVASFALLIFAGLAAMVHHREQQHAVNEERRACLEAKATLTRFHDDAQNTYFLLNARSSKDKVKEGTQSCRTALGRFGVLDDRNWHDSATVRRLPEKDRQILHEEVGQLLVLLAHTQLLAGEREADPRRRDELFREGLQFCSLATHCYPSDQTPNALWKQKGELYQRLNARELALEHFDRANKADFKSAHDRYLTARHLAEEGKFLAALPLIREAVLMRPQDFNLTFLKGICHDHLAQHKDAVACYGACIALRPEFFASWYNRGLTHLRMNDHKSAFADFDQAARLRPEFTEIFLHRALAYQGMQKHAEAIADLTVALERGFAETRAYLLRAKLREKTRDFVGARQDLAEGMRHKPSDDLGWIARGLAHLPGDPKQALADFDEALKINPRSFAALQNKAHVLGKYFKRLEEAVQVLDTAVELYPDCVQARAGRGVYLGRLGKRDAAVADAEASLQIDMSPANRYQVAGIYALTSKQEPDDEPKAMNHLKAALKAGFGFEYLDIDRDLDPVRESPIFRRVVEAARTLRPAPQKPY